ncbi:MAG: NADH-quinone oxidoreductase subunit C [Hydrogenibacillus sp.]|nr:NADH-quinone oxidoreductase subunit C [Hydrogenibacillus sp.]
MGIKRVPPIAPADDAFLQALVEQLTAALGEGVIESAELNPHLSHSPVLVVDKRRLSDVARMLRDEPLFRFDFLNDLHASDLKTHLEVFYVFQSHQTGRMLGIRVKTERPGGSVPSLVDLYPTANWHEREAYDLFGVRFEGHPDLRRILLSDDWVGHPMLKDYEQHDEGV